MGKAITPTNKQRAKRCADTLRHYGTDDTDPGCLADLLADARHWCDQHGECFAELDRRGYQHYLAEVVEARRRRT
jgi:hypothetical protein